MPLLTASLPKLPEDYGYTCMAWYTVQLLNYLFGGTHYRIWFSTHFNPIDNADSSNASEIYRSLSRAVQKPDIGSKMIDSYQMVLLRLVQQLQDQGVVNPVIAEQLQAEISKEPVESYRPEVWRLDLGAIAARRYGTRDIDRLKLECRQEAISAVAKNPPQQIQPDEYLIPDLFPGEFEAIIVG